MRGKARWLVVVVIVGGMVILPATGSMAHQHESPNQPQGSASDPAGGHEPDSSPAPSTTPSFPERPTEPPGNGATGPNYPPGRDTVEGPPGGGGFAEQPGDKNKHGTPPGRADASPSPHTKGDEIGFDVGAATFPRLGGGDVGSMPGFMESGLPDLVEPTRLETPGASFLDRALLSLPPALVEFTSTPIAIAGLIVRTALDGGPNMLVPAGALGLVAIVAMRRSAGLTSSD